MKKYLISALTFVAIFLLANGFKSKKECSCGSLLTNNQQVFWDAKYGNSWLFKQDSTFVQYVYTSKENNTIAKPDRGDAPFFGKMRWKCTQDTLYMHYSGDNTVRYPIIKLTSKELIVKCDRKVWGRDTLFFTPAKNQKMVLEEK